MTLALNMANMRVQGALVSLLIVGGVVGGVSPARATQGELSLKCHNPDLSPKFTSNQGIAGGGRAVSEPIQFDFNRGSAKPGSTINVDPGNAGICRVKIDSDHVLMHAKESYLPEGTNPEGLQKIAEFDFVQRSAQEADLRITTSNPSSQGNVTFIFTVDYEDAVKSGR